MKQIHVIESVPAIRRKRAAIYCRVSTDREDQTGSIQNQRDHFVRMVESHPNLALCGIYFEQGLSGTGKEKRPELERLLEDCRKGKVQTVLTKSVSRFSRNTAQCLEMTRALTNLGVNVIFEKEKIDTASSEGELFLTLLSSMAQEESRSISSNCRWSVKKRFQAGSFKLSRAPYGYRLEEGIPVPEPAEAAVVAWLFESVIAGVGTTSLAKQMNREGIPAKRGKRWHASTILKMLSNEIYMGDLRMQKTIRGEDYRVMANKGQAEQFYIRDHHAALVSRETFAKARKAVEGRDSGSGDRQRRYPLSGHILCPLCGAPMVHRILDRKSGSFPVWYCRKHLQNPASCPQKWIAEEILLKDFARLCLLLEDNRESLLMRRPSSTAYVILEETLREIHTRQEALLTSYTGQKISPASYHRALSHTSYHEDRIREAIGVQTHRYAARLSEEVFFPIQRWLREEKGQIAAAGPLLQEIAESVTAHPVPVYHLRCGIDAWITEEGTLAIADR